MSCLCDVSIVIPEETSRALCDKKFFKKIPPDATSNFDIDGVKFVRYDWDDWNHWDFAGGKAFLSKIMKTDTYAFAYVNEYGDYLLENKGDLLEDYFEFKKYISDCNGDSRFYARTVNYGVQDIVIESFKNGMPLDDAKKYFNLSDEFLNKMKERADFYLSLRPKSYDVSHKKTNNDQKKSHGR